MCYDPSKAHPQVNLSEASFLIEFRFFSSILWRIPFEVRSNNKTFSFIKLLFTATLLLLQKDDYWFCVFGSKQKIFHIQCTRKYWLHIVLFVFYLKNYFRCNWKGNCVQGPFGKWWSLTKCPKSWRPTRALPLKVLIILSPSLDVYNSQCSFRLFDCCGLGSTNCN